ncbi:hypothetical protein [Pedobacter africanus]|uniref:Uncharacterized protein n=1 Tax=Pedobacter africanus TaxID=151894 RepID=A0A1W1ZCK0_9SPHI|nr:hypothetical protein [Pedobacter africanus]SMC46155.1 hypothetical protein SAMN04488524_0602 [Pedobacter africanus]
MEIQLYNQNGLAGIPKRELEISEALDSRMINVIPDVELFEIFKSAVTAAYAIANFTAPKGVEYSVMIDQVMRICKKTYGTIRENEVTIAITRGVLGEYGEFMGLSIKSFTWFVKSYLAEESRIKILAERNKPKETKPEPTLEEQKRDFIQRLEMLYILHIIGKTILQTEATHYFEKLWEAKVIRFTQEQKDELKRKAFEHLTAAKNPTLSKTKDQYDKLKTVYNSFLSAGVEGNEVKRYAMYLGLLKWFDDLKAFDREIRDEIEY